MHIKPYLGEEIGCGKLGFAVNQVIGLQPTKTRAELDSSTVINLVCSTYLQYCAVT